jgi:hypothetical protein
MGLIAFAFEREPTARFIELGYEIHRGHAGWVPPLRVELEAQLSPDFPFYARPGNGHRRFLAVAGGKTVARVMATVDRAVAERGRRPEGAIGFFEAFPDAAAAEDLLLSPWSGCGRSTASDASAGR